MTIAVTTNDIIMSLPTMAEGVTRRSSVKETRSFRISAIRITKPLATISQVRAAVVTKTTEVAVVVVVADLGVIKEGTLETLAVVPVVAAGTVMGVVLAK